MENSIMTGSIDTTTGELIVNDTGALANVPTVSLDDFRRDAFRGSMSRLAKIAHDSGNSDAVLHSGDQLKTADILNHALTIMACQYASVPDGDAMKKYPVVVFAEVPHMWYNMGQIGSNLIAEWAKELGDNPEENPYLPNVNQELADCGGVRVYFRQKMSGNGRAYVSITVA